VTSTERIAQALLSVRFSYANEADLQRGIEDTIVRLGVVFTREVVLSSKDRIDFLTEDGVGIEVKVDGSANDVARQVGRYTRHDSIRAVLLVTTKSRHRDLPDSLNGKPVRLVYLLTSMF
jgi:hypothetical protein